MCLTILSAFLFNWKVGVAVVCVRAREGSRVASFPCRCWMDGSKGAKFFFFFSEGVTRSAFDDGKRAELGAN